MWVCIDSSLTSQTTWTQSWFWHFWALHFPLTIKSVLLFLSICCHQSGELPLCTGGHGSQSGLWFIKAWPPVENTWPERCPAVMVCPRNYTMTWNGTLSLTCLTWSVGYKENSVGQCPHHTQVQLFIGPGSSSSIWIGKKRKKWRKPLTTPLHLQKWWFGRVTVISVSFAT